MRCGHAPVLNRAFVNSLDAYQTFIGGLIDRIDLEPPLIAALDAHFGVTFGRRACVVVADDWTGLEVNEFASLIAGQPVYGEALLVDLP